MAAYHFFSRQVDGSGSQVPAKSVALRHANRLHSGRSHTLPNSAVLKPFGTRACGGGNARSPVNINTVEEHHHMPFRPIHSNAAEIMHADHGVLAQQSDGSAVID
jgi:hypothetical protein